MKLSKKDRQYVRDLSEEYDCPISIILALLDTMPNELYDGVTTAIQDDWDPEDGTMFGLDF